MYGNDDDNRIEAEVCVDCAMFLTNDDTSGASEDWDRMQAQLTRNAYDITVSIDEGTEFLPTPCDVCGTTLAGDRYVADMWER